MNGPEEIISALYEFKDYFLNEVLGVNLDQKLENCEFTQAVKVHSKQVEIGISHA